MLHEYISIHKDNIRSQIEIKSDFLAKGKAKDYSDYKRICGEIKGLKDALNIAIDSANAMLNN